MQVELLNRKKPIVTCPRNRERSTTLGELRAARAAYRPHQDELTDDADSTTVVLSVWQYIGSGYLNPGDVLLTAGVEASLRAAREALLDCGADHRNEAAEAKILVSYDGCPHDTIRGMHAVRGATGPVKSSSSMRFVRERKVGQSPVAAAGRTR